MADARKYLWLPGHKLPPLEAHSEAKHHLFRAYLNAYVNRLTRRPEQDRFRMTVVDGFAGGGAYAGSDGSEIPGSPMILLDEAAAAEAAIRLERTKPFELAIDFTFVDASRPHCEVLTQRINGSRHAHMLGRNVRVLNSGFAEAYQGIEAELLARRGKRRALFFLDQYGYSDAPLALVRRILANVEGAEVILTFAVDALINYLSETERFAKAVQPVELSREDISRLMRLWDNDERSARYVVQNALFDHICRVTGAPYSSPFFVRSNVSSRAYWLVHLSKHHTARDVMGEIHWEVQNSSLHYGREGLLSLGFDAAHNGPSLPFEFDSDARTRSMTRVDAEAPRLIYDAFQSRGDPIRFEDFLARLCSHTPVTRRMLEERLVAMRAAGEIEIVDAAGRPRRGPKVDWEDRLARPRAPTLFSFWNPGTRDKAGTG